MIKPIMRDVLFLGCKSEIATAEDAPTATDLLDTLKAHREQCVGMAANMIGVKRRIVAFEDGDKYTVMFNPEIIKRSGKYTTEEGCLSLSGVRPTERYKTIKVRYQDMNMKLHIKTYEGRTAQIIQHETDHLNGIII